MGFNTQPPEGGWDGRYVMGQRYQCFNTQPPEGGWVIDICNLALSHVSTRSRPKAAGFSGALLFTTEEVSTRSRPKAAGGWIIFFLCEISCFNTQPPEGGWRCREQDKDRIKSVSTRSCPKAAGASLKSLAPSGFAALISLGSQEKREREYNTALSVTPAFAIS